jgi:L-alanine-DL-glutamate epimerase-like enolase superfamily enzyme
MNVAATNERIARVEWATLEGKRPRHAGSNARLNEHGVAIRVPLARLFTSDGASGWGACRATPEQANALLGVRLDDLFSSEPGTSSGARAPWLRWEYPLWDLAAKRAGLPVYALAAAAIPPAALPLRVPCYDTSLYFDDLHLADDSEAAALIAGEAHEGYERGHRAFKIKVGRGARHLPLEAGTQRDIAIVHAVREAVGPEPPLLLDANNGYNLNLAKRVLEETADCGVFWLEEAFHEDPVLYRDLRAWLNDRDLPVLIADGEGEASPRLLDWARDGLVDVIQYDIFGHGFTNWLATGRQLDVWNVRSAPHHYGGHIGNYLACHLAPALHNFTYVEWDEAATPGLYAPGYEIRDGLVTVPNMPGFGLELDETTFQNAVRANGFTVTF